MRGTSNLWAGVIVDGEVRTLVEPGLTATEAPPDLDVARVQAQAGRAPFTVGSVGADTRFRVRVQAQGPLGRTVVYALPLDDVDATLRRLLVVELGGSAIILAVLGLVMFWVVRLGVRAESERQRIDLRVDCPSTTPEMRQPRVRRARLQAEVAGVLLYSLPEPVAARLRSAVGGLRYSVPLLLAGRFADSRRRRRRRIDEHHEYPTLLRKL